MADLYKFKNESENKKNVLRTIYREEKISRNDLIEKTGLSPASVINFVSDFIAEGIVEEHGELESTGGRRPMLLRVYPDYAYIVGVDVGTYSAKIGIVNINGKIIEKEVVPVDDRHIPTKGLSPDELCARLEVLLGKHDREKLLGIGVGISGMVDFSEGWVIFCPKISGWNDVPVVSLLWEKFKVPVCLDTSARCMALAEQWFGAGRGIKDQVMALIGYGSIGAGIIIDSRIYRGADGFAGELGHIQVGDSDIRCTCGNYDCLELYATLPLIIKRIREKAERYTGYSPLKAMVASAGDIDRDVVVKALEAGDKIAGEIIVQTGRLIGLTLANVANLFNPRLLILGGGVIETFPVIVEEAARIVKERSLITVQQKLKVEKAALGWDGAVKGSAVLVLDEFLGGLY